MKFGTAKEIITPTFPTRIACYSDFTSDFSAIHDDVFVRCLVIDDGNEKTVIMGLDLLFHDRSLNDAIENYANEKYGVKKSAVVLSYTHAHTAPAVKGYNPGAEYDEYEAFLLDRTKTCLDRAMCAMFDGTLEYGAFDADFNISRRGKKNGKIANAPNFNYEHDTQFSVICVRDTNGDVRSIIMNYACHPTFYPELLTISGEFPARVCQRLDTLYYGCTSMFLQSAGGDVRPRPTAKKVDLKSTTFVWPWENFDFKKLDGFAKSICDDVSSFIENGKLSKQELSIDSDSFDIKLEMAPQPLEYFTKKHEAFGDAVHPEANNAAFIANGGYETLKNFLPVHCQIIRLSDSLYIAAIGGEPCYGVKKAIVSAFEGKDVFFIGYTDACAYLVDDFVLDEGGYEPTCHLEYCLIGPFKPGLDEKYTSCFNKSFNKIK